MHKLLMALLSLIFITSAVSAIVITEIDNDPKTTPLSINTGENISVSIIRDELNIIKDNLLNEIELSVSDKLSGTEKKIDEYFSTIISKIGLGFLSIALFIFNLKLGEKLFLEMVFKDA